MEVFGFTGVIGLLIVIALAVVLYNLLTGREV